MRSHLVHRMCLVAFGVSLLGSPHSSAQQPAAGPAPALVQMLERVAAGRRLPVVAVDLADGAPSRGRANDFDALGDQPLLGALQAVAEAASPAIPEDARIPFQLGRVWTIAPESQFVPAEIPSVREPYALVDSRDLLHAVIRGLSPTQMARSTSGGLRFSDLTAEQQRMLRAAFASGATVRLPPTAPDDASEPPRIGPGGIPLERCTLHLYLTFSGLVWAPVVTQTTAMSAAQSIPFGKSGYPLEFSGDGGMYESPGFNFPLWSRVPAKLKPSDLAFEAKALDEPIGIRGASKVGEVVRAATTETRVTLRVDPRFAGHPAFVGDASLRTGDVLKALAFGVQGAWRKVGGTYLLTWDREGMAALALRNKEALAAIQRANPSIGSTEWGSGNAAFARAAAENLGPDPEFPLGPTRDQIDLMAGQAGGATMSISTSGTSTAGKTELRVASGNGLPYTALNPRQQEIVRGFLASSGEAPDPGEMEKVTLTWPVVSAVLEVPGVGRVDLLSPGRLPVIVPPAEGAPKVPPTADASPPRENGLALPSGERMVAIPPLLRAEYPRLLEQMQRKGLTTLYLPVLWDGQTLHPGKQFPALSLTRGEDVLKEILDGARARGFRVVGVLHSLAWRFPDADSLHWLRRHPDWVDVDALGRTRREWGSAHPLTDSAAWPDGFSRTRAASDPLALSDFVRPGAPEVRARLMGLLSELRKYPLDGIAFALWTRRAPKDSVAPSLGYALPERVAFLAEHGVDPLDIADDMAVPYPGPFGWVEPKVRQAWATAAFSADIALARDLLAESEKAWPGRVSLFSHLHSTLPGGEKVWADGKQVDLPVADALILPGVGYTPGQPFRPAWPVYRSIAIPAALSPDADGQAERLASFGRDLDRFIRGRESLPWKVPGILLDFRAAPDLLWDALRLLAPAPAESPK